ncbi:MAG: hypothetical protein HKL80_02845 [Acidimicrobiales bacterium]|nr:hypothetical protein [Acidimicrobiales bacterium]
MNILNDRAILGTIGGVVLAALLWWFVGMSTVNTGISSNNNLINTAQSSYASLHAQYVQATQDAASSKSTVQALQNLEAVLPAAPVPNLMANELNDLAQQPSSNCNLTSVQVGYPQSAPAATPSATASGVTTGTLTFTVNGPIANLIAPGGFMWGLQNSPIITAIIIVNSISWQLGGYANNAYSAATTATLTVDANILYLG